MILTLLGVVIFFVLAVVMLGLKNTRQTNSMIASNSRDSSNPEEFIARYQRLIEEVMPNARVTNEPATKSILIEQPNGMAIKALYENVKRDCEARPDSCDETIRNYLRGLMTLSNTRTRPHLDLAKLRATIKDDAYVHHDPSLSPILARPWIADLWMVLTLEHMEYGTCTILDRNHLNDLEMPEDELFERAMIHIKNEFPGFAPEPYEPGSPVRIVIEERAASWLLVADEWEFLHDEFGGDFLASVPNSHTLLFSSIRDVDALRNLTTTLEHTEPHPVSRTLLRWTQKGWIVHS